MRPEDASFCRNGLGADGDAASAGLGFQIDTEPYLLRGLYGNRGVQRNGVPRVQRQRIKVDVLFYQQRAGEIIPVVGTPFINHHLIDIGVFMRVKPNAGEHFVVAVRQICAAIPLYHTDLVVSGGEPDKGTDDIGGPCQRLGNAVCRRCIPMNGDVLQV